MIWIKIVATLAVAVVGFVIAVLAAIAGPGANIETGEGNTKNGVIVLLVAGVLIAATWIFL